MENNNNNSTNKLMHLTLLDSNGKSIMDEDIIGLCATAVTESDIGNKVMSTGSIMNFISGEFSVAELLAIKTAILNDLLPQITSILESKGISKYKQSVLLNSAVIKKVADNKPSYSDYDIDPNLKDLIEMLSGIIEDSNEERTR